MRTYIVAAFSDAPFAGNPAGVCVMEDELPSSTLQALARELNQPVTAFLRRGGDGWGVRWFSPKVEVGLCGHATLGAAHVLWAVESVPVTESIRFNGPSVVLEATLGSDGLIWLDLAAIQGQAASPPEELLACVGSEPVAAARHADRWILQFASADEVRHIQPDFGALLRTGVRSLIVTARSDVPEYDIVSRNFPPIIGINEDHVTGAAHACLAPYWHRHLGSVLRCWQASPRGGGMITRYHGDRVELGGRAVLQLSGSWLGCL